MTLSNSRPKTSGLAITSLVFGILSMICFGLLTGIPAVIMGHISRGKIFRSQGALSGSGLALAGLILGYLSIFTTVVLVALAIPAINGAVEAARATQQLTNARQIMLAVQTMAVDGVTVGDKSLGFPADAGIVSAAELKERLVKGNYLSAEQAETLGFDNFLIGNVSETDQDDVILVRSRPENGKTGRVVIVRKDGSGDLIRVGKPIIGIDPPRAPAYLAP